MLRRATVTLSGAGAIIALFALPLSPDLMHTLPSSVDAVAALLEQNDYFADRRLATSVFLALKMRRPLFLEGEAGVGKTEIAKTLARALDRSLVRLQCYEGLDTASAVYEWNYTRQMIEIRLAEAANVVIDAMPTVATEERRLARAKAVDREALAASIFTERFLIRRPILQALQPADGIPPVLLIDELDRTDEPFEAYLLEVLAEYQVTHSRTRPHQGGQAAHRRHHVEPHARNSRRHQAPLPVSLG